MSAGAEFTLRMGHTAALERRALDAARALADDVFGAYFDDDDWEHSLGGVHALVWAGAELAAHGSVIQRRMLHAGRALRTGYVEAVAVRETYRGQGCGATVMEVLETVIRGAYELGALSATDAGAGFYAARGWLRWEGRASALTPTGVTPTPTQDEGIFVLETDIPLELTGELTCDWRDGSLW